MSRRWLILLIGLPIYTLAQMIVATVFLAALAAEDVQAANPIALAEFVGDMLVAPEWWRSIGPAGVVFVGLQAVFLIPILQRRPPRETRGRSLAVSLLIGGTIAAVLTFGLGAGVMDLIAYLVLPADQFDDKEALWIIPLAMFGVGWLVWSAALLVRARGIWADTTLGRLVGVLLAGTLIEAVVVLPLDIMVRRRTDCYCATGTFITLALAGLAVLWLAGPGVVIALASGRHRLWRETHCPACGYPRGPSPGARCPECGAAWSGPENAAETAGGGKGD